MSILFIKNDLFSLINTQNAIIVTMSQAFLDFIQNHPKICIIQAENPDGDSLGAALALESLLSDCEISLYCPVDIPKYLHYLEGWSRVQKDFDFTADKYIIVDTAAAVLLSKLLSDSAIQQALSTRPVLVIDHHESADDLSFPHTPIIQPLSSCCELIFQICQSSKLSISQSTAQNLLAGIMSDTLGLTIPAVNSGTIRTVATLVDKGANIFELEESRREFMKKSPRILQYKADLIHRVEYNLDDTLATVHITWDDIKNYSDEYNPNVLILEELRMVENIDTAIAIKTYPDGKTTGKIRTNLPIADQIAGYFGGGGHKYAAGFRTYDISYDEVIQDLIRIIPDLKNIYLTEDAER